MIASRVIAIYMDYTFHIITASMDSDKSDITLEIPPDIHAILAEKSGMCGMDESSYAAKVILDYLKRLNAESTNRLDGMSGGNFR